MTRKEEVKRIKGIIKGFCVSVLCVLCIIIIGYNNNHYTAKGTIEKVDNYTITIVDTTGTEWEYNVCELYNTGDKVKVYFSENKTMNNRTDDIITKIKRR